MKRNKTNCIFKQKEICITNINYIGKNDKHTNHGMLTLKIKSSESAVALKRISQLRRPDISNLVNCQ